MKIHNSLLDLLEDYTANYLDAVWALVDLNDWRANYAKTNRIQTVKKASKYISK